MEAAKDENWRYAMQEELEMIERTAHRSLLIHYCTRCLLNSSGFIGPSSSLLIK